MNLFGFRKVSQDEAKNFIINCYTSILKRYPEKDVLENDSYLICKGKKTCAEFLDGIISSAEFSLMSGIKYNSDLSKSYPKVEIKQSGNSNKIKEIIYLGFSSNKPIGGMKVIVQHASIINAIAEEKVTAKIFFPEQSNFDCDWLDIKCPIKRDHVFDVSCDMVIIPELWALTYGDYFRESGIRYGIFVQNGYLLFSGLKGEISNIKKLRDIYANAMVIMSISNHVTQFLKNYFQGFDNKIVQLSASINQNIFYPENKKKNMICYMPRKLASHSLWLVCYLKDQIPCDWELVSIDDMKEGDVAAILRESKIFLSFSDQEGLGLPPLEAAMSGNLVIGYTGGAGEEYWSGQLFRQIGYGDLLNFAEVVINEVGKFGNGDAISIYQDCIKELEALREKYSVKYEVENIKKLLLHISKY